MGSINCSKCHSGCVVPADPISPSSKWHCEKCRHEFHSRLIRTTIAVGRSLVEDCDFTDTKELENFLAKCSKSFPQTSVVLIEIKQKLYGALRDEILREISPKKSTLKRAVELCQESLNLLEIIEPGISRLKGIFICLFCVLIPTVFYCIKSTTFFTPQVSRSTNFINLNYFLQEKLLTHAT